jgi:ATP-dependent DNA ligase
MRIWPGRPYPLGATWDGAGVNFALFSENATKVELCLFDERGVLASVGVIGAFPMAVRRELFAEMQPLVTGFEGHPWNWAAHEQGERTPRKNETSRWNAGKDMSWEPLRPELVIEVAYDHMQGTRLRHTAPFRRWRPDRDPRTCTYDQLDEPVSYDISAVLSG